MRMTLEQTIEEVETAVKAAICADSKVALMKKDVLTQIHSLLKVQEPRLLSREQLLTGWGHGWEESWWIGDDEDPESITLEECVWIDGSMMMPGGNNADADGDYWKEHYNKQYGIRVWIGDRAPTEEERKAVAWE